MPTLSDFQRIATAFVYSKPSGIMVLTIFAMALFPATSCCNGSETQVTEKTESQLPKVILRWKFEPNQSYRGKIHASIRTIDENPKDTSYIFEYRWDVQSIDENGNATFKVVVNRERIWHRGPKASLDLDSKTFATLSLSEAELSEIGTILSFTREIHNQDFIFRTTSRGQIEQLTKNDNTPGQVVYWPVLPEQPVGIGDTWTEVISDGESRTFELINLEEMDGEMIALIGGIDDTVRYRFLVDRGRYLERCGWDIFESASEDGKQVFQDFSSRVRLEVSQDEGKFRNLQPLQPNQPGRAENMLYNSSQQKKFIKEFLLDEQHALNALQNNFLAEIADDIVIPEERDDLSPYLWLVYARCLQRRGDLVKYRQFLREAAEATQRDPSTLTFYKNIFLLQFAELLAEAGDFDAARNACDAISDDGKPTISMTLKGSTLIPSHSTKSYAKLLVIRRMAQAGLVTDSISASTTLPNEAWKCAAHWVIALESAQRGDTKTAFDQCAVAERLYSPEMSVIEFDRKGPEEVSLDNYRTLALGKLATCQAKQRDEIGMRKTLALIKSSKKKTAVIVDMIVALENDGLDDIAETISENTSETTQWLALQMRVRKRIELRQFAGIDRLIDSISNPLSNVESRLELCRATQFDKDYAVEFRKQLEVLNDAIPRIDDLKSQTRMRVKYASILSSTGSQKETLDYLDETIHIVKGLNVDPSQRSELLIEIADSLARVADTKDFERRINVLQDILRADGTLQESSVKLAIMNTYLQKDMMEASEKFAARFHDASDRCKAYCAIGRRYGQLLEMERSREWFSKAFEVAIKVPNLAGLDTVESTGGAIRYVGQQQGDCDIEGLILFLEKSNDPNILAYGWLGGAESLAPRAAALATHTARIPRAMLKDVCDSNLACKLLLSQPAPYQK